MSAIESVGIREFRTHLYKYTRENQEPIALTSHGETIGYYIPAQTQPQKKDLESLRQAVGINLRRDSLYSIGLRFLAYGADVAAISAKKGLFKSVPLCALSPSCHQTQ